MKIRSVEYFLQVAECCSYSTAARKLFVAQSSLSAAIKNLEAELSIKLFYYDGKAINLTAEGYKFYELAREFYDSYNVFLRSAQQISNEVFGELHIILPPLVSELYFSKPISAFHRRYPNVTICVSNRGGHLMQNLIVSNEFDLAVTVRPVMPNTFECIDIFKQPMVLAVNKANPLSKKETVRYEDLKDQQFIAYEDDSVLYHRFRAMTREAGFVPNIVAKAPESPFLLSMVEDNSGVCIIPQCVCEYRHFENIKFIKVEGEEQGYEPVLIYKKDKILGPAAQIFVDFIKEWFSDMNESVK